MELWLAWSEWLRDYCDFKNSQRLPAWTKLFLKYDARICWSAWLVERMIECDDYDGFTDGTEARTD